MEPGASLATWVEQVIEAKPDVVVLAELLPHWSGREAAVSLSRQAPQIPVLGVIAAGDVIGAVRWFQAGAADVLEAPVARQIMPPLGFERPATQRFVDWARRRSLSGTITLFPDTPFEGTVRLANGALTHAQMFALPQKAVLEQLLEARETELRWVPEHQAETARVLVVEDDAALRKMVVRRLETAGYLVTSASDGVEALDAVEQTLFDLMVLDLHMPRLDGWSVLRTLQGHPRHRELPVVLLSAHDSDVDALKAARAGARAYLKKSGHVKDLLASVDLLTRPRRDLLVRLRRAEPCAIETLAVGTGWLLSTLAAQGRTGLLELEDQLGRYELRLREGRVVDVVTQQGSLRSMGANAFDALASSRGSGQFTPSTPSPSPSAAPTLERMLSESTQRSSERARVALTQLALQPERLVVHDELGALYGRAASVDELNVLSALRQRRSLDALTDVTQLSQPDVEDIVHHLLWRGVVALEPAGEE